MKLTWNQQRALERTARFGVEATVSAKNIAEPFTLGKYLCASAARTALMSLQRKGLVKVASMQPITYQITDAGLNVLAARHI